MVTHWTFWCNQPVAVGGRTSKRPQAMDSRDLKRALTCQALFRNSTHPSPLASASTHRFTSESVSEGAPRQVCDYMADSILDAYIAQDPQSRVACEVLCKEDAVVVAGEITSRGRVDHEAVARQAIRDIGYTDRSVAFNAKNVRILQMISKQSADIAQGVDQDKNGDGEQGAGDRAVDTKPGSGSGTKRDWNSLPRNADDRNLKGCPDSSSIDPSDYRPKDAGAVGSRLAQRNGKADAKDAKDRESGSLRPRQERCRLREARRPKIVNSG
jgi:S-adenosylmethionine synthetase, N-terminal domain